MSKATLICSDAHGVTFNSVAMAEDELISVSFDPIGTVNGTVDTSAAGDTIGTTCSQNKFNYEPIVVTKFYDSTTDTAIAKRTNAEIVISYFEGDTEMTYTAWATYGGGKPVTVERDQDEASGIEHTFNLTNKNATGVITAPVTAASA
jgi:hypothetical protein